MSKDSRIRTCRRGIRGVPVVTLIDPDGVIEREGLGVAAGSPAGIASAVRALLDDPAAWKAASDRCLAYMPRIR